MRKAILASMFLAAIAVIGVGQHGKTQIGGKTANNSKAKPKPSPKSSPYQDKPWYSPCGVYFKGLDDFIDSLKDEWGLVAQSNDGIQFYFNRMKPQTCEVGVLTVWIKTAMKDSKAHSLDRYQLKCAAHQLRIISSTDYDKDGRILNSASFNDAGWSDAIPDSTGEFILQSVCRRTW